MAFFEIEVTVPLRSEVTEIPETVGQHLQKRRQKLHLLQKEVAGIIGVSEESISLWEKGRSKPQNRYAPKIIDFLGYNPFHVDGTLGGQIKIYRLKHGLTQKELADILRVDESSILTWENNRVKPSRKKRKLLNNIINQKELSE